MYMITVEDRGYLFRAFSTHTPSIPLQLKLRNSNSIPIVSLYPLWLKICCHLNRINPNDIRITEIYSNKLYRILPKRMPKMRIGKALQDLARASVG